MHVVVATFLTPSVRTGAVALYRKETADPQGAARSRHYEFEKQQWRDDMDCQYFTKFGLIPVIS